MGTDLTEQEKQKALIEVASTLPKLPQEEIVKFMGKLDPAMYSFLADHFSSVKMRHSFRKVSNDDEIYWSDNRLFYWFRDEKGILFDTTTGALIGQWDNVLEVKLSADRNRLLIIQPGGNGCEIGKLIDVKTGAQLRQWRWDNMALYQFSADGKKLFIEFTDDTGRLIDTQTGDVCGQWDNVKEAEFYDDDNRLFIKFNNNTATLIDANTGTQIKEWVTVDNYKFSADGNRLFIKFSRSFEDSTGRLIDTKTGAQLGQHWDKNVYSYIFSADEKKLFIIFGTYGNEHIGRLIDTQTGTQLGQQWNNVTNAQFSDDGGLFIVFGDTARLYNLKKLDEEIDKINSNIKKCLLLNGIAQAIRDTHNKRVIRKNPNLAPVQIEPDEEQFQTFRSLPRAMWQALESYVKRPKRKREQFETT